MRVVGIASVADEDERKLIDVVAGQAYYEDVEEGSFKRMTREPVYYSFEALEVGESAIHSE